jgi:hypothetical protein
MSLLVICEITAPLEFFATPDVCAHILSIIRMYLLVFCEITIRLKSFVAPNVRTLPLPNIQMPFLVCRQLQFYFERLFALLTRLRVNMVAYEVEDPSVCEVVMLSQRRRAIE